MMMKKHGLTGNGGLYSGLRECGRQVCSLRDEATKTIYELDDQQKPVRFAGQKVKVTGTYDKATETIHVTDITASA